MSEQLKASIARIFSEKDTTTPVGAGFLVPNKYILTCAHVVTQALSLRDVLQMPPDDVHLDFPFAAPGRILNTHVVYWQPKDEEDIAVLELEALLPGMTRPVRLVTADDLWGHSFRAFGFPVDYDKGVWASGVMRDRHAGGWVQIESVNIPGHRVVQGFSGTPVWDERLDGVAGMVVESDTQASVKTAYIIPSTLLIKVWPGLGQEAISPCPYRGLFAFREIDEPYFFGRETYIEQLVEVAQKKPLVTVLGPSGSGKSSVVFAGLLPRLRQAGNWLITSFRPGNQPFRSLATALIPLLESQMSETDRLVEIKKLAERFQKEELTLHDVVERIVQKHSGVHLLLIADQFEELYTLCSSVEEQRHFLDFLLVASRSTSHQRAFDFNLIIALRADFLGHALSYRPFADALQNTDIKLGPMTRQELRDAIKRPAEKLKIQVDGELIERILGTVGKEPGYLPLLEFALTLLWKKQQEGKLTLTAYEEIGGVEQSLAAYADEVYRGLREEKQRQAQQIFVQLVRPGEGTEDTRRVATRIEIGEENWDLVVHLSDARLIVSGRDEALGVETVEIVHEALIGGWRRLQEWIEIHRVFRIWQERLRAAIRQWESSERDEGALLRGALLIEAEGWMAQRPDMITPAEQVFIQVSRGVQIAEEQRKLKGEFLVTASHELRTPLSAISGYSTLLKRQSGRINAQQILRFASKIAGAAQQLADLVSNMTGRISDGTPDEDTMAQQLADLVSNMTEAANIGILDKKLELQRGPIQLRAAGEMAVNMLSVNIEQQITMNIGPDLWVDGDPLRIRQVITNLLDNAAKYSPPDGRIEIIARTTTLGQLPLPEDLIDHASLIEYGDDLPVVLVQVHDEGEGILPEDQQKIFEKFVRAPRSLTTPVRGSGLGLYICRRYIEAMGGKLWLEQSIAGEGSVFSFYLPRISTPVETREQDEAEYQTP